MMKQIKQTKVTFEVFGKIQEVYTDSTDLEWIESVINQISPTAHIRQFENAVVTPEIAQSKSIESLINWNQWIVENHSTNQE